MANGPEFPAFIKLQYQRDGSAKSAFLADVDQTLSSAEDRFRQFSGEAQNLVDKALSVQRNTSGSLDLGVEDLRAAAAAQQARATAAREVAQAMDLARQETQDYSQATRLQVAAAQALAIEEERAAQAALAHARAAEQVQERLNRQASATDMVVAAQRRGTDASHMVVNSVRAERAAYIQAGQQLQDISVQMEMGTKASTIFAQQVPQLAFALSGLAESANPAQRRIGQFAEFLSGPWGAAIFIAVAALGPLVAKLFESGEAADQSSSATSRLKDKLDIARNSYESLVAVVDEYNKKQDLSTAKTYDAIMATEKLAAAKLKEAQDLLISYRANAVSLGDSGDTGLLSYQQEARVKALEAQLAEAQIAGASERAKLATDPRYQIEVKFNEKLLEQQELLRKGQIDANILNREAIKIAKEKAAALDALNKRSGSGGSGSRSGASPETIGPADVAAILGVKNYGGTRSAARNRAVGGAPNSYHQIGQAIDIPLTVNGVRLTKEGIRKTLTDAGIQIKELLGPGDKGHSDHFHIAFAKTKKSAEALENAARKAREELEQFGANASESIIRINERFDEQPRLIDQASAATRRLDALIKELGERKPEGFAQLIADAEAAKGVIADALVRPYRELTEASERRLEIDRLITAGREDEAAALQVIWGLERDLGQVSEERRKDILEMVRNERLVTEELERRREVVGYYLQASRSLRDSITDFLATGKFSIENIGNVFRRLQAEVITEKLFGSMFRDLDQWLKGQSGLGSSVDYMSQETRRAGSALSAFADAAARVTSQVNAIGAHGGGVTGIAGGAAPGMAAVLGGALGVTRAVSGAVGGAANDNGGIVVMGRRDSVMSLTPANFFSEMANKLGRAIGFNDETSKKIGKAVGGALEGGMWGQFGAQAILGKNGGLGSMIGGAIGKELGGKVLGKALGDFAGPVGGIVGGVLGGLVGKLFSGSKWGTAVVGGGIGGNNNDARNAVGGASGSIADAIGRIAEQLGGTVGGYNVSIGQMDGKWRVSTTGRTGKLENKYGDVTNFGENGAEAALRFAIADAIKDGAIQGISASAARLLQKYASDVERGVQKVLSFENVFRQLKAMKDPVGAALDELNKEFAGLKKTFEEAGASAEEFAKLEELYTLRRAEAIKQASEQLTSSLRGLLDELTVGNDALSLRERKSMALAKYSPLAARVAAGDTTAYNDFAEAARVLLDIERQISGSQSGYFNLLAEVTGLTKGALDSQQKLVDAATASDSPFAKKTDPANDNQAIVGGLGDLGFKLDAVNQNLSFIGQVLLQGGGESRLATGSRLDFF